MELPFKKLVLLQMLPFIMEKDLYISMLQCPEYISCAYTYVCVWFLLFSYYAAFLCHCCWCACICFFMSQFSYLKTCRNVHDGTFGMLLPMKILTKHTGFWNVWSCVISFPTDDMVCCVCRWLFTYEFWFSLQLGLRTTFCIISLNCHDKLHLHRITN